MDIRRSFVKQLLQSTEFNTLVNVKGWVRTKEITNKLLLLQLTMVHQ